MEIATFKNGEPADPEDPALQLMNEAMLAFHRHTQGMDALTKMELIINIAGTLIVNTFAASAVEDAVEFMAEHLPDVARSQAKTLEWVKANHPAARIN